MFLNFLHIYRKILCRNFPPIFLNFPTWVSHHRRWTWWWWVPVWPAWPVPCVCTMRIPSCDVWCWKPANWWADAPHEVGLIGCMGSMWPPGDIWSLAKNGENTWESQCHIHEIPNVTWFMKFWECPGPRSDWDDVKRPPNGGFTTCKSKPLWGMGWFEKDMGEDLWMF